MIEKQHRYIKLPPNEGGLKSHKKKGARYLIALVVFLAGLLSLWRGPSLISMGLSAAGIASTVFLLYTPSQWVEDGFATVSHRLKISALVAGAVFLAMSSSAPEFFTSFSGVVLHGIFDIGIITILWSALFNLCIIIGACSLYKSPLKVDTRIVGRDMPFYGISILILAVLGLDNEYSSLDFALLVGVYLIYIAFLYFDKSAPYEVKKTETWSVTLAKIGIGLVSIAILSHLLVVLGLRIISISQSLYNYAIPVGLVSIIIFAPATSISDLFMSIAATKKGEDSTAIVNGIGSNTFDITMCLGLPGLIFTLLKGSNVSIDFTGIVRSLGFLAIGYLFVFIVIYSYKKVSRPQGVLLTVYFVAMVLIETTILLD